MDVENSNLYFDGHNKAFYAEPSQNDIELINNLNELKSFDLDVLHEHNLKIFGDVFESIIGAVFMDS